MKKHLKKLRPLLLLTALFLFTNCQEEFEENKPVVQQKNGSKYTILTGETARAKKAELLIELDKDGGKGISNLQQVLKGGTTDPAFRDMMDIKEYIDDSEIFKVEQANGNINYTYRVNMPDAADNKFYNLVVKKNGVASKTVLLTYNLSKEFTEQYQNDVDISKFTGEIIFNIVAYNGDFPCGEEPSDPVPVNGGGGSGAGGVTGGGGNGGGGGGGIRGPVNPGNPGVPYNQLLVDLKINALKIVKAKSYSIEVGPIEGGIDGGGTIPGTLPGIFDRYIVQTPRVYDEIDPCGDGEDIGVLDPAKQHEDNCDELKKFAKNTKNLASLRSVEQTSTNDKENGYSYDEDKDPVVLKRDPISDVLVEVPSGGKIYGASHDHPDPTITEFIPMFSVSDVVMLGKIRKAYFNPGQIIDNNKFILTLTVNRGNKQTFALKIENWATFDIFLTKYAGLSSLEKKNLASRLAFDYSSVAPGSTTDTYLEILFKFMNKNNMQGVSIYKANSDFSNWAKLSYDKTSKSIIETPCK